MSASSTAALPDCIGLLDIDFRCDVSRGALQVVGDCPVIFVVELRLSRAAQSPARRRPAARGRMHREAGVGEELAFLVLHAFGHDDRAIAVFFDGLLCTRAQNASSSKVISGNRMMCGESPSLFRGESACRRDPARMSAHHFHDEDFRRGLRHRGDVEARFANRHRNIFRDRAESGAAYR